LDLCPYISTFRCILEQKSISPDSLIEHWAAKFKFLYENLKIQPRSSSDIVPGFLLDCFLFSFYFILFFSLGQNLARQILFFCVSPFQKKKEEEFCVAEKVTNQKSNMSEIMVYCNVQMYVFIYHAKIYNFK
jgi:hypothetical protein